MSGGSYDYVYNRIDDLADEIVLRAQTPLRRAFAAHLRLVAKAAHDIEWVDSSDYGEGDEEAAIRAVIAPDGELREAESSLRLAVEQANDALRRLAEAIA